MSDPNMSHLPKKAQEEIQAMRNDLHHACEVVRLAVLNGTITAVEGKEMIEHIYKDTTNFVQACMLFINGELTKEELDYIYRLQCDCEPPIKVEGEWFCADGKQY